MIQPFLSMALWAATHGLPADQPEVAQPTVVQDATAPAEPKWTGSILGGGIVSTGNSETRSANVAATAEYKREHDRITLNFLWIYADEKNTSSNWNLTDRKTFGSAKYDYFFSEKTYAYGLLTAENDFQQDIKLRWTGGAGAGHQYLDNETWKFSIEAGLSYFDVDYYSSKDKGYVAARIATDTTYNINKSWSFLHKLNLFPSLETVDDFYGQSDLGVEATLTKSMVAKAQWVLDYDNTPAAGAERVDNRYLLSVGWKF